MANEEQTRSEYLRALLNQRDTFNAYGNNLVNPSVSNNVSELAAYDTMFSNGVPKLNAPTQKDINNIQQTEDKKENSILDSIFGFADEIAAKFGAGFVGAFEGIVDLGATGIAALMEAGGADTSGIRSFIETDYASRAAEWTKNYGNFTPWGIYNNLSNIQNDDVRRNFLGAVFGGPAAAAIQTLRPDTNLGTEFYGQRQNVLQDMGKAGDFIGGAAYSIGFMLPSIMTGGASAAAGASSTAAKAASLASMGLSASGKGSEEALNDGADSIGKALGYGVAKGAVEVASEIVVGKALEGVAKATGLSKYLGTFGKINGVTYSKELIKKASAKELVTTMFEEGAEEVFSDLFSPICEAIYKGSDAFKQYGDKDYYKQMAMSFASGAFVGGLTSGVQTASQYKKFGKNGVAYLQNNAEFQEAYEAFKNNQSEENAAKVKQILESMHNQLIDMANNPAEQEHLKNLVDLFVENSANNSLSERVDVLKQELSQDAYTKLANDVNTLFSKTSGADVTIVPESSLKKVDGAYPRAFLDGNHIVINETYKAQLMDLIKHEGISHALLDLDTSVRNELVNSIESNPTLKAQFHKFDNQLEQSYKKSEIESERLATFTESVLKDYKSFEKAFKRNFKVKNPIIRFFNNLADRFSKIKGIDKQYVNSIQKVLKSLNAEAKTETKIQTQLAYSKDLSYNKKGANSNEQSNETKIKHFSNQAHTYEFNPENVRAFTKQGLGDHIEEWNVDKLSNKYAQKITLLEIAKGQVSLLEKDNLNLYKDFINRTPLSTQETKVGDVTIDAIKDDFLSPELLGIKEEAKKLGLENLYFVANQISGNEDVDGMKIDNNVVIRLTARRQGLKFIDTYRHELFHWLVQNKSELVGEYAKAFKNQVYRDDSYYTEVILSQLNKYNVQQFIEDIIEKGKYFGYFENDYSKEDVDKEFDEYVEGYWLDYSKYHTQEELDNQLDYMQSDDFAYNWVAKWANAVLVQEEKCCNIYAGNLSLGNADFVKEQTEKLEKKVYGKNKPIYSKDLNKTKDSKESKESSKKTEAPKVGEISLRNNATNYYLDEGGIGELKITKKDGIYKIRDVRDNATVAVYEDLDYKKAKNIVLSHVTVSKNLKTIQNVLEEKQKNPSRKENLGITENDIKFENDKLRKIINLNKEKWFDTKELALQKFADNFGKNYKYKNGVIYLNGNELAKLKLYKTTEINRSKDNIQKLLDKLDSAYQEEAIKDTLEDFNDDELLKIDEQKFADDCCEAYIDNLKHNTSIGQEDIYKAYKEFGDEANVAKVAKEVLKKIKTQKYRVGRFELIGEYAKGVRADAIEGIYKVGDNKVQLRVRNIGRLYQVEYTDETFTEKSFNGEHVVFDSVENVKKYLKYIGATKKGRPVDKISNKSSLIKGETAVEETEQKVEKPKEKAQTEKIGKEITEEAKKTLVNKGGFSEEFFKNLNISAADAKKLNQFVNMLGKALQPTSQKTKAQTSKVLETDEKTGSFKSIQETGNIVNAAKDLIVKKLGEGFSLAFPKNFDEFTSRSFTEINSVKQVETQANKIVELFKETTLLYKNQQQGTIGDNFKDNSAFMKDFAEAVKGLIQQSKNTETKSTATRTFEMQINRLANALNIEVGQAHAARYMTNQRRIAKDFIGTNIELSENYALRNGLDFMFKPIVDVKASYVKGKYVFKANGVKNNFIALKGFYDQFRDKQIDSKASIPYDPQIAQLIQDIIDSIGEPQIQNLKNGGTREVYGGLTTRTLMLMNDYIDIIKKVNRDLKTRIRMDYMPSAQQTINSINTMSYGKRTDIISNLARSYKRGFAPAYVVIRQILGGNSVAADVLTTQVQLATNEKQFYVGQYHDNINKALKKFGIKKTLDKTTFKVNGADLTADQAMNLYLSLEVQANYDAIDQSGVKYYTKNERVATLAEKGNAKKLKAEINGVLPQNYKDFADFLLGTMNGKIKGEYIEWYEKRYGKFNGRNEIGEINENTYWTLKRAYDKLSNLEVAVSNPDAVFVNSKARKGGDNYVMIGGALSTVTTYIDRLGTEIYLKPKYREALAILNTKTANGKSVFEVLKEKVDTKDIKYLQTTMQDIIGALKPTQDVFTSIMSRFSVAKLSLNLGSILKQYASIFTSNISLKNSTKAILAKMFNKEAKAEFLKLIGDDKNFAIGGLKYRATNSTAIEANVDTLSGLVEKFARYGMAGITKMDGFTVSIGVYSLMVIGENEFNYKIGSQENIDFVRQQWAEFELSQIGSGALSKNAVARGDYQSIAKGLFAFLQGANRAALGSQITKYDLWSRNRNVSEVTLKNNLSEAKKNLAEFEAEHEGVDVADLTAEEAEKYTELRTAVIDAEMKMNDYDRYKIAGGKRIPINMAAGLLAQGLFIALISELMKHIKGKKDWDEWDIAELGGNIALSTFVDWVPFVNSISSLIKGYDVEVPAVTILNEFGDIFSNAKSGNIKGVIRQIALLVGDATGIPFQTLYDYMYGTVKAFDPATAYELQNALYGSSVQAATKSLNYYVEKGNAKKTNSMLKVVMDRYRVESSEETRGEITDLLMNGYRDVLPKQFMTSYVDENGETVELTKEQIENFRNLYNQAEKQIKFAISMNNYRDLTKAERAKLLKKIYDIYYGYAKGKVLGKEGDTKLSNLLVLTNGNVDIAKYVFYLQKIGSIEASKTKSKKELTIDYINKIRGFSSQDKLLLMYLNGYSVSGDSQTRLLSFLIKKGMTRKQAKAFLKIG